jgi:menaquinone-9 beta-reductase
MSTLLSVVDEAEVIVVGAGPAGASCAALLAEQGHDVLLVDQFSFPRDKPCGDGLTRSAVAFLERMGLDDLIASSQPVDGLRMVIDHNSIKYSEYGPTKCNPHRARCIPRSVLDKALFDAATDRGARFLQARVIDRAGPPGSVGVQAVIGSEKRLLQSRFVVAADGATSRLRRTSGYSRLTDELAAYAVRAYFRCERSVEPIFDTYMPLEFESMRVAGYGWVFPIDEHLVNIGVGYWRGAGISSPSRIREVLASFVEQLRCREGPRFGELEQISKLAGSPLGVQFHRDRCENDGIVFVGDAARMTDPWSGEGIAYALHGAEKIAELIRARARGHGGRLDAGTVLGRRFSRLGQDLSFPLRLAERRLNHSRRPFDGNAPHPFLRTMQRAITTPEEEPNLLGTPVGEVVECEPEISARLQRINEILLDELETGFPFAAEILHCEVRTGLGPMSAVAVIVYGSNSTHEEALLAGASAIELVSASAGPIREIVDRPRSGGARLNNALCVLITDFALSRAAHQAVRAGASLTQELSVVMKRIYQAQFAESQQLFNPDRSVEDYVSVAQARMSAPLALAARFAALTHGHAPDLVKRLDAFGWKLGLAAQIYADLEDLLNGSQAMGQAPGRNLRLGAYALPVLHAAGHDKALHDLLLDATDQNDMPAIVESMFETGAMAKTLRLVAASVEGAEASLNGLDGCGADGLRALAMLTLERTRKLIDEYSPISYDDRKPGLEHSKSSA